uniref:Uncharacterized protein n=1 Tax=Acrobeloides nanus TaxID=290746 RepID=A0A914DDF0_9BILA
MARVGTSDGQADQVGIQNIINSGWGWNGWVYLDPCTNTTGCPSPAEHVQRVNYSLNLAQPQELNKTNYGMFPNAFFINIQGQWSSNRMVNQQILTEYVQAAAATFEGTSFITDYTTWSTNFGPYWTVPASAGDASGVPFIWWRKYDGRTDTNGFSPFGNFTMVLLKQYAQNVNNRAVSHFIHWTLHPPETVHQQRTLHPP